MISIDHLVYGKVEQKLRREESGNHPENAGQKATGKTVTFVGYVKVHSAPHAYEHGGEAESEDFKCAPLLRSFDPQTRRLAGTDGITCGTLHLFNVSATTRGSAKGNVVTNCKNSGAFDTAVILNNDQVFIRELLM
jgi:hypothetical protein